MTSLTKQFLRVHWDREKPLLLGYSGGPDSKALLYALLECGVKPNIAHVDHGWREESRFEAESIRKEAEELGCPFFSTRLECKEKSEDEARKGRYAFFSAQFPSHAALLLAHQADDLAETVLKRIFEGANLVHLGGMQEVSHQWGMTIWRPFLSVRKSDLETFLKERSLIPFNDRSNIDPAYLRTRLREDLFPFLKECFGKEIRKNLCLLSKRTLELKEYLNRRIEKIPIQQGPWGTLADFSGLETVEQRHILQKIVSLNRDQIETVLKWVKRGEKQKILPLGRKKIFVDSRRVWVFSCDSKDLSSDP